MNMNVNKKFLILFSVLILSLLVFCIFQVNALTEENYLIKSYEKKIIQLSEENEILTVNFSKTNSLVNLESYLQSGNFKKVSQVKYIQILESSVAAK